MASTNIGPISVWHPCASASLTVFVVLCRSKRVLGLELQGRSQIQIVKKGYVDTVVLKKALNCFALVLRISKKNSVANSDGRVY